MKHTSSTYWLESLKEGKQSIVAHTKKGKSLYHEFLSKKQASDLLAKEKEVSPEYQYRVVKKTVTIEHDRWT